MQVGPILKTLFMATKTKFKKGDRVKISASSKYYRDNESCNPKDVEGFVIKIDGIDLPVFVKWDNGEINSYDDSDLIKAK